MLDKLLFNNQIITNKKKIQKARSQIINKLVQKIRKLKALDEKKPNNAKIQSNLEKAQQVMGYVKKMKVLDIVRKVLILNKKAAAILTNGQAPREDIAVALLSNNKILLDIVVTLRTILSLDDNNPKWREEIMELSKRKKKLLKTGGRKKTESVKTEKKPTVKRNPWKEENVENGNTKLSTDTPLPANEWKVEPLTDSIKDETSSIQLKTVPKLKVDNKVQAKVVRQESRTESADDELLSISQKPKPVKIVDSFFFTETGDNYLSTVVIDRVQPDAPDDGLVRRERRDNTMRPYKRNNSNYNNNKRQPMQNSTRNNNRQRYEAPLNAKPQVVDEKIHPSWAAKQKLKPIITQFTGQKITFGDDGVENTVQSAGKNSKSSYQPKASGKVQPPEENLHPSWAAKQKQKPAITEFKGKKITFDD